MRLSELKFEDCLKPGSKDFCMHVNASDDMTIVQSQKELDEIKNRIIKYYGDVEVKVDFDAPWFNRVQITDPKWQSDYDKCIRDKAEWHHQFGSN